MSPRAGHSQAILTEIYIEALLVDEEVADQAWDAGEIDDIGATLVYLAVTTRV